MRLGCTLDIIPLLPINRWKNTPFSLVYNYSTGVFAKSGEIVYVKYSPLKGAINDDFGTVLRLSDGGRLR